MIFGDFLSFASSHFQFAYQPWSATEAEKQDSRDGSNKIIVLDPLSFWIPGTQEGITLGCKGLRYFKVASNLDWDLLDI